jgi:hypothetical protein
MATLAQHFERLCDALDEAAAMDDRAAAAEYLQHVSSSLRRTPRNSDLRLWFLKAALEIVSVQEGVDVKTSV